MFEDTFIGVRDKYGKPYLNGSKVKSVFPDDTREYQIIWDQEDCAFKLLQLNLTFTLKIPILDFLLQKFYVVMESDDKQ